MKEYKVETRKRKTLIPSEPKCDPVEVEESIEEMPVEAPVKPAEEKKEVVGATYPPFNGAGLVNALEGIGEDGSFENRIKIAKANGIPNYYGRPDQNTKLLQLAANGLLKRA